MSIDRRSFLKIGGAGLFGISLVPLLTGCEEDVAGPFTGRGAARFITPNDEFYLQYGGRDTIPGWTMPSLTWDNWSMKITGAVDRPLTITKAEINAARNREEIQVKTMQCILQSTLRPEPAGFTGTAYWTGIPLKHFLDMAGIDPENTRRIVLIGADRFSNNLLPSRLADTKLPQPLLAYQMNGKDLTREHGAPVRLIVQETYGYKNIKWLTEVNASIFDVPVGNYQREGYIDDGVIRINSDSTNVYDGLTVPAGPIQISGFAVSGYGPIQKVEVSIDNAGFQLASLIPLHDIRREESLPFEISQLIGDGRAGLWNKWKFLWNAPAGAHTITVRATDSAGNVQPNNDPQLFDGQSGMAQYSVTIK